MRKEYYDRLVKKLENAYNLLIEHNHPGIPVSLTKRELEDLHYLFKHQSPKIWSIDEHGEDDALHAKGEDPIIMTGCPDEMEDAYRDK